MSSISSGLMKALGASAEITDAGEFLLWAEVLFLCHIITIKKNILIILMV